MTDLKELKYSIKKYNKSKNKLDQLLKDNGPAVVASTFQEILKDCPNVVVFWRQGTPSFNDGDPCRFRVHDMWICPIGEGTYGEDNAITEDGKCQDQEDSNEVLCTPEQQEKLYEAWYSLDSYILEQAFDEACVTISVDEVTTDEFDRY